MLIKLWDWEKKWSCSQVFEGHTHYVMQIVINPKDNNQFASASLDRTIKVHLLSSWKLGFWNFFLTKISILFNCLFQVWQLGSSSPNFTLEGHEKGVNCIDYYSGGDKPYLISGADDRQVKIWDYQVWRTHFFFLYMYKKNIPSMFFWVINSHVHLSYCLCCRIRPVFRLWRVMPRMSPALAFTQSYPSSLLGRRTVRTLDNLTAMDKHYYTHSPVASFITALNVSIISLSL